MVKVRAVTGNVVIIGAGASGLIAAGRAAETGAPVILLEKMATPARKLLISGNNRCNLTNAEELNTFISRYGANGKFLYSAFSQFFRDEILSFFKRYDLETKEEVDGRIFPASGDSNDVVKALKRYIAQYDVQLQTGVKATSIQISGGRVTGVRTNGGLLPASAVVLATGGASYPQTGSSGDGYKMARSLGHTIVKIRPGLVPLVVKESQLAKSMQGVSLPQVRLTAYSCPASHIPSQPVVKKDFGRGSNNRRPGASVIASKMGDMMITHFGIGGPITLQMSLTIVDALENSPVSVAIDLRPDLSHRQLDETLQQLFDIRGMRNIRNILFEFLPQKMIVPFLTLTKIPADKLGSQISTEERKRVTNLLKSFRFNIQKPLPLASAMVTAGGIALQEINPRTMESRIVSGLYFCGEVMDIDADTGGYNLTAAFSTGYMAGEQTALFYKKEQNGQN